MSEMKTKNASGARWQGMFDECAFVIPWADADAWADGLFDGLPSFDLWENFNGFGAAIL